MMLSFAEFKKTQKTKPSSLLLTDKTQRIDFSQIQDVTPKPLFFPDTELRAGTPSRAQRIIAALPKFLRPSAEEALIVSPQQPIPQFAKTVVQGTARDAAALIRGGQTVTPATPEQRAIFGDKPFNLETVGREYADIIGKGESVGQRTAVVTGVFAGLLSIPLNIGKAALRASAQILSKTDDTRLILNEFKRVGIQGSEKELNALAQTFKAETNPRVIEDSLLSFQKTARDAKRATAAVPTQRTTTGTKTKFVIRDTTGQIPAPKVAVSESKLLRERFAQQAAGAKAGAREGEFLGRQAGFREGMTVGVKQGARETRAVERAKAVKELAEMKQIAAQAFKNKAADVAQIKQTITAYAKTKLSPDMRGRLLSAVTTAKTRGDVAKAVLRINKIRNDEIKNELVRDLETMLEKVDALPPNQQNKAIEITGGLTAETFSKTTQAKLAALKEFLAGEPDALFRFGAKTLKKTERAAELGKKRLEDVPLKDLIALNDRLEHLFKEGKLFEKTTNEIKQLRVENALKEISESGARNLDEGLPPPRKPGTPETSLDYAGARDAIIEGMRKGTQHYVSPDVGLQIFDHDKWRGAIWRIFKRPIDTATELENEMRNEFIDALFVRIKTIEAKHGKLATENYENVMFHATLKQPGGRAKLQKSDSSLFTDEFLDSVKLTDGEMEFYKLGREIFDELRPHIERVLWNTRGEKLGKVDNYWSWITDFDNSDELFMRLSGDYKNTSRTEQGFTKSRTLVGTQKLNLNALDVLVKHINDSAAFIHKEELLNHLGKIARSDQYANAVGKMGQRWTAGWIDLISRGGVPKGYRPGILTLLVRNLGHGVLGFRLSPIVKQPLAKIVSTGFLGKEAFMYDPQFYSNFAIRDSIHKISKQQRYRNFDDPTYTALAKAKRLATWQRWGYQGIKTFDSWTADSVWYAAYRKNLKDRGLDFSFSVDEFTAGKNIDNEAREWADLIVRRTQGSSDYKDAPLMYAAHSNKDLVMAALQFQRFVHNQSIMWRDAKVALIKEKDPVKAAAIASSLVAAGIAESYVSTGIAQVFTGGDYAEKEREKTISSRVFNTLTGQLPIISNLASIAEYGGAGVPVWDVSRQGFQGAVSTFTAEKPETRIKGAIRAGEAAASLSGVSGAGQFGQILRRFVPTQETDNSVRGQLQELRHEDNSDIREELQKLRRGDNSVRDRLLELRR